MRIRTSGVQYRVMGNRTDGVQYMLVGSRTGGVQYRVVGNKTGPQSAVRNMSDCRYVSDCRSRGREFDLGPVPDILLWRLIMK